MNRETPLEGPAVLGVHVESATDQLRREGLASHGMPIMLFAPGQCSRSVNTSWRHFVDRIGSAWDTMLHLPLPPEMGPALIAQFGVGIAHREWRGRVRQRQSRPAALALHRGTPRV